MGLNRLMMGGSSSSEDSDGVYTLEINGYDTDGYDGVYIADYGYYSDYFMGNINPTEFEGAGIQAVHFYQSTYIDYGLNIYYLAVELTEKVANQLIVTVDNVDYTLSYAENSNTSNKVYNTAAVEGNPDVMAIKTYFVANVGKDVQIKIRKGTN